MAAACCGVSQGVVVIVVVSVVAVVSVDVSLSSQQYHRQV